MRNDGRQPREPMSGEVVLTIKGDVGDLRRTGARGVLSSLLAGPKVDGGALPGAVFSALFLTKMSTPTDNATGRGEVVATYETSGPVIFETLEVEEGARPVLTADKVEEPPKKRAERLERGRSLLRRMREELDAGAAKVHHDQLLLTALVYLVESEVVWLHANEPVDGDGLPLFSEDPWDSKPPEEEGG